MWLWLALQARAEVPLPSYRDELVRRKWAEVDDRISEGDRQGAIKLATDFEEQVTPDATLEYLIGLAWRLEQKPADAEAHYKKALEMNPDLQEGWNDLGELMLVEGHYDEAERDFLQVDRLVTTGKQAWIGPWRLAEIAAHQDKPDEFEKRMKEALERGFSFRMIEGLPNWQAFYADPVMHDSIDKLVTVYGDRSTLDSLRGAPKGSP